MKLGRKTLERRENTRVTRLENTASLRQSGTPSQLKDDGIRPGMCVGFRKTVHLSMSDAMFLLMLCKIGVRGKLQTSPRKMVNTALSDEEKGIQDKESKEESILAMLGIIGTILNLVVIIFVYIYTTLVTVASFLLVILTPDTDDEIGPCCNK
ncbi:hypothetical protein G5714_016658 [Onychostoma macrolepis]|uniref:Uncharacterized protein n=1 Tax=Onychostoma macrolepis TaxID=369639 RepID=A0A7J6C3J3_9TELE|nr:hypothetical protein G5714_016658 [Onychostoma macrolepis]